jgi:hypothetical protein
MTRARRSIAAFGPCVAVALALSFTRSASAQQRPDASADVAREVEQLLAIGVDFRRRGDDDAALESFRRAYELRVDPRTSAQLGLAEQALGFWARAERHLLEALAGATDPWIRRHAAALRDALEVVQDQLGSLELSVRPAGARVSIDGETFEAPVASPIRLRAGVVRVEVSAAEHLPVRLDVPVSARGTARETIVLRPVTTVAAVEPVRVVAPTIAPTNSSVVARRASVVARPRPRRAWWTPARVGATVTFSVSAAAATAVGVSALVLRDAAVGVHNDNPRCPVAPECAAPRAAERSWTIAASVAIPTAALAVVGAALSSVIELPSGAAAGISLADRGEKVVTWSGRW